uniref:Sulfotransferase n=1 Tax=Phallusia mammillata TaxID=59560 RepID=A0A6F9DU80_9ASCI|nr:sulfotransferase 1C2-like [Phallusia mammillata]
MQTGTTWTAEIVRHLIHLNDKEMQQKSRKFNLVFNYLEFGPVSKYEAVEAVDLDRRCFGTHLPSDLVNLKKFKKIIYVIRNPKDQLVSWYHFAVHEPYNLLPQDAKEFFDLHIQGVFSKPGEGYLEHVTEWYRHKNDENIMFLAYEDLKQNPLKHIKEIAEFIEVKVTEGEISEIAENTSFKSLKKASKGNAVESVQMFRKGQIGDWKNHLKVAQSEAIDRKVEEILGDTDIKFTYEI